MKKNRISALLKTVLIWTVCVSVFTVGAMWSFAATKSGTESVKYLNGDSNGDNHITVSDATVIQRVLINSETDSDGMITLRGDIDKNGLELTDATNIQKYLAQLENPFQVGKTMIYTPPAQPTTEVDHSHDNELPKDEL